MSVPGLDRTISERIGFERSRSVDAITRTELGLAVRTQMWTPVSETEPSMGP